MVISDQGGLKEEARLFSVWKELVQITHHDTITWFDWYFVSNCIKSLNHGQKRLGQIRVKSASNQGQIWKGQMS